MASESANIQLYSITTGECFAIWEGHTNRSVLTLNQHVFNIVYNTMMYASNNSLVGKQHHHNNGSFDAEQDINFFVGLKF